MHQREYAAAWACVRELFADRVDEVRHTERVLHNALLLADGEPDIAVDVLVLSALLHDCGKARQSGRKHAEAGAELALELLAAQGWSLQTAERVASCIRTHSTGSRPATREAKILYDADKLDGIGAVGVARAAALGAGAGEPLYVLGEDGLPCPGKRGEAPSLLRDYRQSLRRVHHQLYTKKARKIAAKRQKRLNRFFDDLYRELQKNYRAGRRLQQRLFPED